MINIRYVGASWCKPCKLAKPEVIKLCERFNIDLKIIDYDDDMTSEEQSDIKKLPSIFIYDDNKQVKLITANHVEELSIFLIDAFAVGRDDEF